MDILLVRHGQSLANVDKAYHKAVADHAIPLSPKGERQAEEAGSFLKEFIGRKYLPEQVRLWASPYTRSRQTAAAIKVACSKEIGSYAEHTHLCEQQFGLFDGLFDDDDNSEIKKLFPQEYEHYKKCEDHNGKFWARMPLGESRFDVAVRVHQAFGTFHRDLERHGIKAIVVVSHGVTIRAFIMQWLHKTPEWFESEPNPKNCSIRFIHDKKDMGYIHNG